MTSYNWAHEDKVDYIVNINWAKPITHDMLYTGLSDMDDSAYFYAIIGLFEGDWWPYYIGMVYSQNVSDRHKNKDHQERLEKLKKDYPKTTWHLTLGTPLLKGKRLSKILISEIEGLLIYGNWHDELINKSKINRFSSSNAIKIINEGFSEPFFKTTSYGVFNTEE